ncbi:GTPase HflX [Candidatus Roizmanbacteria bacterium CG11_big_fil_rev_8_21_14_0_20_37_16]|uniref:GTPase HflX n=1 Tax=Candidatus Roizmanbacteria bacterium CG11_big_fil_rev_8_21_14_0_20_37_16 TaxID=1974857 RepID=A0A2H0KJY1_9BACT|nr:MAG: GTPase HflX [Candidatus Roizmanbacteria bacterium CG11_big_fil_rev_8_21_14_0_20_37_16]
MQKLQMFRSIIIDVVSPNTNVPEAERNLIELKSLIKTYGSIDVGHIIQHRTKPDKDTFIGSGKVQELIEMVSNKKIDILILNDIVKPTQLFHLTEQLWTANPDIKVWDRVDLILHIFEKHAQTTEARLQIEIAKMHHMGPRIYGLGGTYFSRQGGGIGSKGVGETNIERMKRHWRTLIKKKEDELKKQLEHRKGQVDHRKELGVRHIALVGYTNAGKTALFNVLTGRNKISEDVLFATLSSTVGRLKGTGQQSNLLISDTIGFIQNLPPSLIQTFKSTLLDVIHADLILHIVDISDELRDRKIDVVQEIIHEIGAGNIPQILVFTKSDLLPEERWGEFEVVKKRYSASSTLFISSKEEINIKKLTDTISERITKT